MTTELKIPEVGESITEVQISEWLKSEGDEIKTDEPLAVIDSEKTTFELPSPKNGHLVKILYKAGDTVKVGQVVAEIESNGAAGGEKPTETKAELKQQAESGAGKKSEPAPAGRPAAGRKPEKKETKENGVPMKPEKMEVKTGKAPEVSRSEAMKEELEHFPEQEKETVEEKSSTSKKPVTAQPADDREEEVVPMTMLRRTVARRLVEAQQAMAMLTTFNEVDMSAVMTLRKEHAEAFEKRYQVRLGLMSFFVKAAIDALKQFPKLNAEIRDNDIIYHNYFDIGVAIATERGLVVPVLRRAERLSIAELEKAIGEYGQAAKAGKLKPDALEGGTFTITNGGVFGSLLSTPIINPPQTGILGMHTIQQRPMAVDGQVVIRPMMYLALTYDHRLVDGREAVLFLRRVKEAVETPARMLLEI